MKLAEYPRTPLAHLPTPLEILPRLTAFLGGPRIYVKRDDQTGLAMGGNKARKLEYLVADALALGCDTLLTTGGPQSNHARQTAAAAARLGLSCELVLPRVVPISTPEYERSGNILLDRLLGANLEFPPVTQGAAAIDTRREQLIAAGKRPYFIPTGGSTPLGALGYVRAVDELFEQARAERIDFSHVVVPTGSGGTHAGILAGLLMAGHSAEVHGIAVSGTQREKAPLVRNLTEQVLQLLDETTPLPVDRVRVDDRFVGPGYGLPTPAMLDAVTLVARLEGLLLDPVYTGKAMAGLIHSVRSGQLSATDRILFWHTGGTPALFAYQDIFARFD